MADEQAPWEEFQGADTATEQAPWEEFAPRMDIAQTEAGNIDVSKLPAVKNADGSVSTVKTISIGTDKGEVLIPTVVNGKVVTKDEAIKHFHDTGENLGTFLTPQAATAFAKNLHESEAQRVSEAAPWEQFKAPSVAAETLPAVIQDIIQHGGERLSKLGEQLKTELTTGEAVKPIGGGLPMLEHQPDESFLAGAGRAAYNAPAGLINAVATPAGLATVASFAAGQPEIGAALIAAQLAPGALPFVKRTAEAATGQLSAGESMEQAFNLALLVAPGAHEYLPKDVTKIEPVTPAGTKVTDYVKQGDVAHVSAEGVTEPPPVPAYATTQYAYPRVNLALKVMPPDVIEAMVGRKPVAPQSVHFDSPSPITETAAEKAMRLTTGEPLKTGAEIAMEGTEAAPAELLSVRLARELADARKSMLAELKDLQQQNATRAAQGQRQDPKTTKRITALTAELSMPTVGVPVSPNSPIELVVQPATVSPGEVATAVAESTASTAAGETAVGQQQVEPSAPVGVGGGPQGAAVRGGSGTPVAGGLARSTIEDQIQRGILPQDALVIGKGWNAEEAATRGDFLLNQGVRPDVVLDALQGKRKFPVVKGKAMDPGDAVAVLQSETRRLAAERAAAQKQYGLTSPQAHAAEAVENNWLKNTRPKAGGLAQRVLKAFEDTEPVDLSNYDHLYKKASQFQEGKPIADGQKIEMMRRANGAKTTIKNADDAVVKRQKVVDRTLPKVKTPTKGEMKDMIDDLVRELTPCE